MIQMRTIAALCLGLSGCGVSAAAEEAVATRALTPRPSGLYEGDVRQATTPFVLAHGGQGSPANRAAAVAKATEAAWAKLSGGASATEAAVVGVMVMEDDPRFNAGTGANVRLDGTTVECDAAIMDDAGNFGAVAGLRGFANPILAARAVMDTPHLLIAGEGATNLAGVLDMTPGAVATPRAQEKLRSALRRRGAPEEHWESLWNFPTPYAARMQPTPEDPASGAAITRDTVGVVVRDADGRYAAALSTGGTATALLGRVGDVPQYAHGLFAGPHGAVAATGKGEAIIRTRVASRVYEGMAAGQTPQEAIRRATWEIGAAEGVGVVAISDRGHGASATSQMAWAGRDGRGTVRADTVVERDAGRWTAR